MSRKVRWGCVIPAAVFLIIAIVVAPHVIGFVRFFFGLYPRENQGAARPLPKVTWASFSPVEDTIVFSFRFQDFGGIFLMDHEGRVFKWLCRSSEKRWFSGPVFSPDGQRIAFESNGLGDSADIFIMDKDGSHVRRLTSTPDDDFWPAFSPDGKKLYFIRSRFYGSFNRRTRLGPHRNDLFCVELESGKEYAITDEKLYQLDYPNVMPGGDRMLLGTFNRVLGAQGLEIPKNSGEGYNLWTVELKKPPAWRPVIPNLERFKADIRLKPHAKRPISYSDLYNPVLSRDGRFLVFSWWGHYSDLPGYQLYITDMCTMETERITKLVDAHTRALGFSPDNKRILLKNLPECPPQHIFFATNLWMINRDGTGLRNFVLDFSAVADKPPVRE